MTDISFSETMEFIDSYGKFVKNSEGKYTTLAKYNSETPFFKKIADQIRNSIK